jgi:hypothetical protein
MKYARLPNWELVEVEGRFYVSKLTCHGLRCEEVVDLGLDLLIHFDTLNNLRKIL